MGRASSSKKVARAASTGGGRTARGSRPWGWYAAIALVVVLGFAGIFVSRDQRRDELAAGADLTPPRVGVDHWHAAYGIYLCDEFVPGITDERDPKGIHTHGDGVIHIHPAVRSAAGKNATLGVFADAVRMDLSDTEIKLPGGKSYKEGDTECDGKPGVVQVEINDKKLVTDDIRNIRPQDGDLITIAFAPEGADLPVTPTADQLNNLTDVPEGQAPPTTVATGDAESTTTTAAGDTTTTSTPGETTTTSAP